MHGYRSGEGKLREFLNTHDKLYQELCYCSEEFVHDPHVAESIVLEKLRVYSGTDLFTKEIEMIRSYLFVAVRNASIDHWRKENRRTENLQELADMSPDVIDQFAPPLSPDHAIIVSAVLGKVRAMVDQLPEHNSMVIEEYYYKGKSIKEIAEEYHIPEQTLYQYKKKGIGMLREKFDRWGISARKAFEYFFGK